jgi:hypothetical protein
MNYSPLYYLPRPTPGANMSACIALIVAPLVIPYAVAAIYLVGLVRR